MFDKNPHSCAIETLGFEEVSDHVGVSLSTCKFLKVRIVPSYHADESTDHVCLCFCRYRFL